MPFLTELSATKLSTGPLRGRALWRIDAPLVFESQVAKQTFTVPVGFLTNFASVPRLPLVYLLAGDTAHEAAALHDYLYSKQLVSRALADQVFLEAMEATGEPAWRRYAMYAAVRGFGASHYKQHETPQEDPYGGN